MGQFQFDFEASKSGPQAADKSGRNTQRGNRGGTAAACTGSRGLAAAQAASMSLGGAPRKPEQAAAYVDAQLWLTLGRLQGRRRTDPQAAECLE